VIAIKRFAESGTRSREKYEFISENTLDASSYGSHEFFICDELRCYSTTFKYIASSIHHC